MSAVLMTLFAVSILGALGMAVYGLRVLVGRWEQPRQHEALLSVPKLPPLNPLQPQAGSRPQQVQSPRPRPPGPVWVPPAGSAPAPLVSPAGVATPPPMLLPTGLPPAPPTFMPPQPGVSSPAPAPLTFMPPQPGISSPAPAPLTFMPPQPGIAPPPPRIAATPPPPPPTGAGAPPLRVLTPPTAAAPQPRAASPGKAARALSPRIARGSIPPDYSGSPEVEPDTDPGLALDAVLSDTVVQRGARFSVVRSNRR